ncbi:MAG TPA: sigma-70 family RNA polymerase sigma factor [Polyangiaceae bacterium]|nr:sigma-70 family RNA polymerase sigma factor [Polyangiaceae bacterium]
MPSELSEASDAALAVLLQARAPGAARAAWERFSPLVRRILVRALGPARDVEDSIQEVFLCLFTKVPELRNPAALRAFVVSITIRTLRHEIRRRKLRSWLRLDGADVLPDLRSVSPDTDAREALTRFYALLDRINTRDRSVFVLHLIEGMDVESIASALQVSVPTVRRCFTRARDRIALLAGHDPMLVDYVSKFEDGAAP